MEKFTEKQLASFKAVAKTAASRASEALSKLIGIPVKLETTRTRVIEIERLTEIIVPPEESVSAVYLPVTGESKGSSVLVSSLQESLRMAELVMRRPKGSLTKLDDPAISALKETANIIGGAFLSEFSNMTGRTFIQSVPEFLIDTMKGVVDTVTTELHHGDSKLSVAMEIDLALSVTTTEKVGAHYIFLLEVASAQKLLEALH